MVADEIIADTCPYPECGGKLKKTYTVFGYCEKCRNPVFACESCNTFNRSFAHFCRECGKRISFPETSMQNLQFTRLKFEKISRNIILEESFVDSPKAYKGLPWFLSESGKVWTISPYSESVFSIGSLGTEFGNSPFLITELTVNETSGIPYLISISPQSVRGLNLITRAPKDFLSLASSEEIVCARTKSFYSIAENNGNLYFLKRKAPNGIFSICRFNLADNDLASFDLDKIEVAGPIKVGNFIITYSRNKFYLISEEDEIKSNNFRSGFNPCLSNNDFQELYPAHGSQPSVAIGNSFYLQGFFRNKPGFLYIDFGSLTMSQVFVPLPADSGIYSLTALGNPIIATDGRIVILKESALVDIKKDDQITAQNVPFYAPPLTVAFAQGSGGRKLIRFYWDPSNMISEYNIGALKDFSTAIGFFILSDTLTLVYIKENKNIGILIWDL